MDEEQETSLIEILTGESGPDIEFAFDILNSSFKVSADSYKRIVEALNKSGKWHRTKRFGFDFIERPVKEQDTSYFILVDRENIPALRIQLNNKETLASENRKIS